MGKASTECRVWNVNWGSFNGPGVGYLVTDGRTCERPLILFAEIDMREVAESHDLCSMGGDEALRLALSFARRYDRDPSVIDRTNGIRLDLYETMTGDKLPPPAWVWRLRLNLVGLRGGFPKPSVDAIPFCRPLQRLRPSQVDRYVWPNNLPGHVFATFGETPMARQFNDVLHRACSEIAGTEVTTPTHFCIGHSAAMSARAWNRAVDRWMAAEKRDGKKAA